MCERCSIVNEEVRRAIEKKKKCLWVSFSSRGNEQLERVKREEYE